MNLTRLSPPLTTPIAADELRDHLGEPRLGDVAFDEVVDARVLSCLNSAVAFLDGDYGELGLALIDQEWREEFRAIPANGRGIALELAPVSAISLVEIRNTNGDWEVAPGDFELIRDESRYFVVSDAWPVAGSHWFKIRVSYVAGFGATPGEVPENLRRAILLLGAHFYEIRQPVLTDQRPIEVPLSVDRLIAPFKTMWR